MLVGQAGAPTVLVLMLGAVGAGVVLAGKADIRLKHIEFVRLEPLRALAVLVGEGAVFRRVGRQLVEDQRKAGGGVGPEHQRRPGDDQLLGAVDMWGEDPLEKIGQQDRLGPSTGKVEPIRVLRILGRNGCLQAIDELAQATGPVLCGSGSNADAYPGSGQGVRMLVWN